jgi:hypothetical protein
VNSFQRHFRRARRFVINAKTPEGFQPPFSDVVQSDPDISRHLIVMDSIGLAARSSSKIHLHSVHSANLGGRFLAKLALGIGRELLGESFLDTGYAAILRTALWERHCQQRAKLPVRGSGYLSGTHHDFASQVLKWPGAWLIWIQVLKGNLTGLIISPRGHQMAILICDEAGLLRSWAEEWPEGQIYLAIPAIKQAIGPVAGAEYLAHKLGNLRLLTLANIETSLQTITAPPPCR